MNTNYNFVDGHEVDSVHSDDPCALDAGQLTICGQIGL